MILINNKYELLEHLGEGAFGYIFKAKNINNNKLVALKIEPISKNTRLLINETRIYQHLRNISNIPKIKWFGRDDNYYYMVIDLLGNSLNSLVINNKSQNNINLVNKLAIKLLNIIRSIHNCGIIHRDIKPDNFLFDLNNSELYLIDFGLSISYLDADGKHKSMRKSNSLIGSLNYASINAHNNNDLSRRDDLFSLFYVLLYLYYGELLWCQHEEFLSNNDIIIIKSFIIDYYKELNIYLPHHLEEYYNIIQQLNYYDEPNYDLLINLFML